FFICWHFFIFPCFSSHFFSNYDASEGLWDAASIYIISDLLSCINQTNSTNSSTVGGIVLFPYYQHSLPTAALFTLAYLFIFLLCLMGNSLVCVIVLRNRHMRTVTNIFILNLAVSDLLVGIFCIPTTLVDNLITGERRGLQCAHENSF
uniref:G-protein coupled receptors family 1 profile domain-containing protein n=1 Tax=Cyprinus carpio TaxID=7962 RepID=A0A8C1Y3I7_CYPCA